MYAAYDTVSELRRRYSAGEIVEVPAVVSVVGIHEATTATPTLAQVVSEGDSSS